MLSMALVPRDIQGHKTNRVSWGGINELNVLRRRPHGSFYRRVAHRLGSCNSTPVSPNDPLRLRPDLFSPAVAFTWAGGGSHGSRGTAEGCEVDALKTGRGHREDVERRQSWREQQRRGRIVRQPLRPARTGGGSQSLEFLTAWCVTRSRMNLQASTGQQSSSGKRSRVHVKKSVRSHDRRR